MIGLRALWWVSLSIAAAALLIMVSLILARAVFGWRADARGAERRRLVPLLLGGGSASEEARPEIWLAKDFIAELMVELIQLVRGSDRDAFVARAAELQVPERLRHHLSNASPRIRQQAAEALGLFCDDRSTEALTTAIDDVNADVRLTAALALARQGRAPPVRDLVRRLDIGRSEKSLLVTSLFRELIASRRGELADAVADPNAPATVRIAAADALAGSGDYAVVPRIVAAAIEADPGSPELPRYLQALGRIGHPAAAPAVEAGLSSRHARVRSAAAEAAGRIGMADLAPRLAQLLADPSWSVRRQAGDALLRIGPEGRRLLEQAALLPPPAGTAAAAMLAEERGS